MSDNYSGFIFMKGCKPFYDKTNVSALVKIFKRYPNITPYKIHANEGPVNDFNIKNLWNEAQLGQYSTNISIRGDIKNEGYGNIYADLNPLLIYQFPTPTDVSHIIDLFNMAEELSETFQPQHLACNHAFLPKNQKDATEKLMYFGSKFLLGLSWRNVFGSHYIKLLGRDFLLNIPNVIVTESDWGGIYIDLACKPWELSYDELHTLWKSANDYLLTSDFFAKVESSVDEQGKSLKIVDAPNKIKNFNGKVKLSSEERNALLKKWGNALNRKLLTETCGKHIIKEGVKLSRKGARELSNELFNQLINSTKNSDLVEGVNVVNINLKGNMISGLKLKNSKFENNYMQIVVIANSHFEGCNFKKNFMREAHAQGTKIVGSLIIDCFFEKAQLYETELKENTFTNCNFQGADLSNSEIMTNSFINCNFTKAKLNGSTFKDTIFENCDFTRACPQFSLQ